MFLYCIGDVLSIDRAGNMILVYETLNLLDLLVNRFIFGLILVEVP